MILATEDTRAKQITVGGRTYTSNGGFYNVPEPAAKRIIAAGEGAPINALAGVPSKGYPCACGFNSFFRECSRCGRENDAAA